MRVQKFAEFFTDKVEAHVNRAYVFLLESSETESPRARGRAAGAREPESGSGSWWWDRLGLIIIIIMRCWKLEKNKLFIFPVSSFFFISGETESPNWKKINYFFFQFPASFSSRARPTRSRPRPRARLGLSVWKIKYYFIIQRDRVGLGLDLENKLFPGNKGNNLFSSSGWKFPARPRARVGLGLSGSVSLDSSRNTYTLKSNRLISFDNSALGT